MLWSSEYVGICLAEKFKDRTPSCHKDSLFQEKRPHRSLLDIVLVFKAPSGVTLLTCRYDAYHLWINQSLSRSRIADFRKWITTMTFVSETQGANHLHELWWVFRDRIACSLTRSFEERHLLGFHRIKFGRWNGWQRRKDARLKTVFQFRRWPLRGSGPDVHTHLFPNSICGMKVKSYIKAKYEFSGFCQC